MRPISKRANRLTIIVIFGCLCRKVNKNNDKRPNFSLILQRHTHGWLMLNKTPKTLNIKDDQNCSTYPLMRKLVYHNIPRSMKSWVKKISKTSQPFVVAWVIISSNTSLSKVSLAASMNEQYNWCYDFEMMVAMWTKITLGLRTFLCINDQQHNPTRLLSAWWGRWLSFQLQNNIYTLKKSTTTHTFDT